MDQKVIEKLSKSLKYSDFLLKEVIETLDENKEKNDDGSIHKEAWVVLPYNQCLTSLPPQYVSTIYHYYDENGLDVRMLESGQNTKIFFSEDDAKNYVKSLGTQYDIINIPPSDKIHIGDDYE